MSYIISLYAMSYIMAFSKIFATHLDFGGHMCRKLPIQISKLHAISFLLNNHRLTEIKKLSRFYGTFIHTATPVPRFIA